jgi:hypothetical protein
MSKLKAATLFVTVLSCTLCLGVVAAMAYPTAAQMKAQCVKGGGVYFPPSRLGAYACLTKNGDLVVCGGYIGPNSHYCDVSQGRLAKKQMRRLLRDR